MTIFITCIVLLLVVIVVYLLSQPTPPIDKKELALLTQPSDVPSVVTQFYGNQEKN